MENGQATLRLVDTLEGKNVEMFYHPASFQGQDALGQGH